MDAVLRAAAVVDAEAAALRTDIQDRQRMAAMRQITAWIGANGPLRMDELEAGATVWALTSPELHQLMRGTGGLDREGYRRWLEGMLRAALLPS